MLLDSELVSRNFLGRLVELGSRGSRSAPCLQASSFFLSHCFFAAARIETQTHAAARILAHKGADDGGGDGGGNGGDDDDGGDDEDAVACGECGCAERRRRPNCRGQAAATAGANAIATVTILMVLV